MKSISIIFRRPLKKNVIVFDSINSKQIVKILDKFHGLTYSIFEARPLEINISWRILLFFFLNLGLFEFSSQASSKRGLIRNLIWQLVMIYVLADLKSRMPKIIITSIDNCEKFAWLGRRMKGVHFVGIQNGHRASYDVDNSVNYYCEHLFCFGFREPRSFPYFGYSVDNFHPVGSLQLSQHFNYELSNLKPIFDILIVSCWRGNIDFAPDVAESMTSMKKMDLSLAKYLSERQLKSAVILRSERNSDDWFMSEIGLNEEQYYKDMYGDLVEIIDVDFEKRNIYPTMQSSDLIIASHNTTCLLEAMSFGKKVLYANFTGKSDYHCDFDETIVFDHETNNDKKFYECLDKLRSMPDNDYANHIGEIANYYVLDPRKINTQLQIKEHLKSLLNEKIR